MEHDGGPQNRRGESARLARTTGLLWPGLWTFPFVLACLYIMARFAHWLTGHLTLFEERPGLAGGLTWLVAISVVVVVFARRRHFPLASRGLPDSSSEPQTGTLVARLAEMPVRVKLFVEALIYAFATVVILLPASLHPTSRVIGSDDAVSHLWLNWSVAESVKSGNLIAWHLDGAVVPDGLDLRLIDSPFATALGAFTNLFASPVFAYNLAVAIAVILNILAARKLARYFTPSRIPTAIAGLAYASAPALSLRALGHYNLLFAFMIPILLLEAIRVGQGEYPLKPWRVGPMLALSYLCGIYQAVFGAITFLVVLLTTHAYARGESELGLQTTANPGHETRILRHLMRLCVAGLIALFLLFPFIYARFSFESREQAAGAPSDRTGEAITYSADAFSLFTQPRTSTFGPIIEAPYPEENVLESTTFPGFILLLSLAGVAVFRSALRIPLLTAAVVNWILSMGPALMISGSTVFSSRSGEAVGWLPYQLLLSLPGLGALRAPNRASFALAAILTGMLALSLGAFWSRSSLRRRVVLGAICTALLISNLQVPLNWTSIERTTIEESWLTGIRDQAGPGATVLNVPGDCLSQMATQASWQIYHRIPFVGCQGYTAQLPVYSGMTPYMTEPMAALRCIASVFSIRSDLPYSADMVLLPSDIAWLRSELGVRFIIVDKVALRQLPFCASGRLDAEVDALRSWYRVLGESDTILVVDTGFLTPLSAERTLVDSAFVVTLGRLPTTTEAAELAETLKADPRHAQLVAPLRSSEAFQTHRCALANSPSVDEDLLLSTTVALYDEAFVWLVYRGLLGREPDPQGLTAALAFLANDHSKRVEYLVSVASSDEFRDSACGPPINDRD